MARRYTERKHTLPRLSAAAMLLAILLFPTASGSLANVAKTPVVTLDLEQQSQTVSFLSALAHATLERHFGSQNSKLSLAEFAKSFPIQQQYKKSCGLFVTFSKNGKTRACWGSTDARFPDLITATVFTTEQALTDEYRFKKISASEIDDLKVQVTVVKKVESLHTLSEQNPRTCGMLVRSGGKSGIILPGECTDAYYQMVQCKLKAGIQKHEPCQMYRIRADVYR